MMSVLLVGLLAAAAGASVPSIDEPRPAPGLDPHLDVLEPFIGVWVGGYADSPRNDGIVITTRWESMLAGRVARRTIDVPAIEHDGVAYSAETFFYWDWQRGFIAFLALNTRGLASTGKLVPEGNGVVMLGVSSWPDRTTEFKSVVEILPDGRLQDLFFRLESGEWVQGHRQVFTARADRASSRE